MEREADALSDSADPPFDGQGAMRDDTAQKEVDAEQEGARGDDDGVDESESINDVTGEVILYIGRSGTIHIGSNDDKAEKEQASVVDEVEQMGIDAKEDTYTAEENRKEKEHDSNQGGTAETQPIDGVSLRDHERVIAVEEKHHVVGGKKKETEEEKKGEEVTFVSEYDIKDDQSEEKEQQQQKQQKQEDEQEQELDTDDDSDEAEERKREDEDGEEEITPFSDHEVSDDDDNDEEEEEEEEDASAAGAEHRNPCLVSSMERTLIDRYGEETSALLYRSAQFQRADTNGGEKGEEELLQSAVNAMKQMSYALWDG